MATVVQSERVQIIVTASAIARGHNFICADRGSRDLLTGPSAPEGPDRAIGPADCGTVRNLRHFGNEDLILVAPVDNDFVFVHGDASFLSNA